MRREKIFADTGPSLPNWESSVNAGKLTGFGKEMQTREEREQRSSRRRAVKASSKPRRGVSTVSK